jgi:hypothetical protein
VSTTRDDGSGTLPAVMERDATTSTDGGWWYRADVENGVNACRVIADLFPTAEADVLARALDTADLFAAGVVDYGELRNVRVQVEVVLAELAEAAGVREIDGEVIAVDLPELGAPYLAVLAVRAAIHRQPERAQRYGREAREQARAAASTGGRWPLRRRRSVR